MVMDLSLVAPIAIMMPNLLIAARSILVWKAMRMQPVVFTNDAGDCAFHDGVVDHLAKCGFKWQQVVAGIARAIFAKHVAHRIKHARVKTIGQLRL